MEKEMTKGYRTMSNRPRTFTGKGWIRMVIDFNLITHLKAWKNRCNLLFDTKNDFLAMK